jgi:hypothetical protein
MDQALTAQAGMLAGSRDKALNPVLIPLAILGVALLSRVVTFGNPAVILDDQFYLLVGDAMRHGQWPYIDIWDRKPFGLFLLFEGIAALGNGSILVMQLVATLSAAATALVLRAIARMFVGERAAFLVAVAYLLTLPALGGISGQTPVFYNLFIASAAWLLLTAAANPDRPMIKQALLAMRLCGLAMAIKPVALFEGAAFGLSFLWLAWRRGARGPKLAGQATAMIAVALLPVLLPYLAYALHGADARHAYEYANFISIFQKDSFGLIAKLAGLSYFAIYASPLLLAAAIGLRDCLATPLRPEARLLLVWLAAAFVGYASVPHFFDHYALPLLAPLSVVAGWAFERRSGPLYAGVIVVSALLQGAMTDVAGNRASRSAFALASERIEEARHGGCLFVAEGPTFLYRSTGACRLTRYLFPHHINLVVERNAVGFDQLSELNRILARRPAVIVTRDIDGASQTPAVRQRLEGQLPPHYRTVYQAPADLSGELAGLHVWQRRDLPPPDGSGPR